MKKILFSFVGAIMMIWAVVQLFPKTLDAGSYLDAVEIYGIVAIVPTVVFVWGLIFLLIGLLVPQR